MADSSKIKLIFHGKHEHPLISTWSSGKRCRSCRERFYGSAYKCSESCQFYLHRDERCTGDPDEVENPLHPHHRLRRDLCAGSRCKCCFTAPDYAPSVFYKCPECDFSLDKQCALSIKSLPEDGAKQIDHPLHSHPLTYCEDLFWSLSRWQNTNCKLCGSSLKSYGPFYGLGYGCRECGFFLHEACAELPEALPCRIHPSETLKRSGVYREEFKCHSCGSTSSGFPYRCSLCSLDLDYQCVFLRRSAMTSITKEAGFHKHKLTLYQIGEYEGFECSICGNSCTGSAYACKHCRVFAHQSCADSASSIREVLRHPSHPAHPLTCYGNVFNFNCGGCLKDRFCKVGYRCSPCDYDLDHKCALPFGVLVLHDIHPHHLALVNYDDEEAVTYCAVCRDPCAGPTYHCPDCELFFHKACADSEEMWHPSHPFHLLKRYNYLEPYFRSCCHSCLEYRKGKMYGCKECDFYIDYDCAFRKPVKDFESKRLLLSSIHRHPLELATGGETPDDDGIKNCIACYQQCPDPAYRCLVCNIYAHESCAAADMPGQIERPFCPDHHVLILNGPGQFECWICRKDRFGIYYKCQGWECRFTLDATCASLQWIPEPFVIYDGHEHPLIFRGGTIGRSYPRCNACFSDITAKYDEQALMFVCSICEFYLHFLCGPLPRSIQHELHLRDKLLLMDSVTDDDNGEIYCYSCEEPRDPCTSVYYCASCRYSAEIKCVMPELKLAFSGRFGDLELRTLGRWSQSGKLFSKGLPIEEFLKAEKPTRVRQNEISFSLTHDEEIELDGILSSREKLFEFTGRTGGVDGRTTVVFDREFEELMTSLDSSPLSDLRKWWDYRDNMFVQVGGEYMIPGRLVRVYNALHQKYGDLSPKSGMSSRLKQLLLFHLCWTVDEMCTTKVIDVTEQELANWCISVKVLCRAGFRIQFAIDALRKAVPAYFGSRALKYEAALIEAIPFYEERIREKEAEREAIREKLRHHLDYFESGGPSTVKECIKEALFLRYKTASDVFFDKV